MGPQVRILLISDTHGSLGVINELVSRTQADAVIHAGDFGFEDAMAELGLKEAIIVNRNDDDAVETDRGTVRIVPAWRFLLDIPDQSR
jgi:predicted phosphodiesterase